MNILFDHQIFSIQKYGGISKYFCELMKHLPPGTKFKLPGIVSDNQHLNDDHDIFGKINIPIPDREFKGKRFIKKKIYSFNKIRSNSSLRKETYDLFHPTFYDPYFFKNLESPYIVTVHDLIDFKFPKLYKHNPRSEQMGQIIKKAQRIISISNHTKNDLIEIFKINPDKIDVIHHGFNSPMITGKKNSFGRYILFVGSRWGYKNFSIFIKAMSGILKKDSTLNLVCVGVPFNKKEQEELNALKISEQTFVLGVDEENLNRLYSNALAFVYPTLYEGFGMPILEAFANNCPVCLSNTSSLPEVAGKGGVYFEPKDPDSIRIAIENVIYNPEYSSEMVEAGRVRLKDFSWKKCGRQTSDSYKKAISEF